MIILLESKDRREVTVHFSDGRLAIACVLVRIRVIAKQPLGENAGAVAQRITVQQIVDTGGTSDKAGSSWKGA